MKYLSVVVLLLVFGACKEIPADIKVLHDKAMEIHDGVMPRMSEMNKLNRKVKKRAKENPALKEKALSISKQLDDADDAMMDWMGQFQKYRNLPEGTNATSYYKGQIESISIVEKLMLNSIEDAKNFLSNE